VTEWLVNFTTMVLVVLLISQKAANFEICPILFEEDLLGFFEEALLGACKCT
jgi:hypothetical protein